MSEDDFKWLRARMLALEQRVATLEGGRRRWPRTRAVDVIDIDRPAQPTESQRRLFASFKKWAEEQPDLPRE